VIPVPTHLRDVVPAHHRPLGRRERPPAASRGLPRTR
jgi:hypothetical protein